MTVNFDSTNSQENRRKRQKVLISSIMLMQVVETVYVISFFTLQNQHGIQVEINKKVSISLYYLLITTTCLLISTIASWKWIRTVIIGSISIGLMFSLLRLFYSIRAIESVELDTGKIHGITYFEKLGLVGWIWVDYVILLSLLIILGWLFADWYFGKNKPR